MEENRQEAYKIIGNHFNLKPEGVAGMLSGVKFLSLVDNKMFLDINNTPNAYEISAKAVELYKKAQIIKESFQNQPTADWIDSELLTSLQGTEN
jgi:hypothetical protein